MMLYVLTSDRCLFMKKSLEALIGPMPRTEFLENYLGNTPVVTHGRLEHFSDLTELPFLKSLDSKSPSYSSYSYDESNVLYPSVVISTLPSRNES